MHIELHRKIVDSAFQSPIIKPSIYAKRFLMLVQMLCATQLQMPSYVERYKEDLSLRSYFKLYDSLFFRYLPYTQVYTDATVRYPNLRINQKAIYQIPYALCNVDIIIILFILRDLLKRIYLVRAFPNSKV